MRKRIVLFMSLVFMLVAVIPTMSFGQEQENKVKLHTLYTEIPFDLNLVEIERRETDEIVELIITDRTTGEHLTTLGEYKNGTEVTSRNGRSTSLITVFRDTATGQSGSPSCEIAGYITSLESRKF